MNNSMFCSEGSVQNSKPKENFLISSGNKPKIILPEYSFSKIPSGIDIPIPSQEIFNSMIPSGITLPITMGTNSTISFGGIFDSPQGHVQDPRRFL